MDSELSPDDEILSKQGGMSESLRIRQHLFAPLRVRDSARKRQYASPAAYPDEIRMRTSRSSRLAIHHSLRHVRMELWRLEEICNPHDRSCDNFSQCGQQALHDATEGTPAIFILGRPTCVELTGWQNSTFWKRRSMTSCIAPSIRMRSCFARTTSSFVSSLRYLYFHTVPLAPLW